MRKLGTYIVYSFEIRVAPKRVLLQIVGSSTGAVSALAQSVYEGRCILSDSTLFVKVKKISRKIIYLQMHFRYTIQNTFF